MAVPYDEELADLVRGLVAERVGDSVATEEKRMFGGLAFLLDGNLAVSASGDGGLLVRIGAKEQPGLLDQPHVGPMTMGGRTSRTWLQVAPEGLRTREQCAIWVGLGVAAAAALPPKR